jgi:hypothetical protein
MHFLLKSPFYIFVGKKEPHIRVLAGFVGVDGINYGAKNSSV